MIKTVHPFREELVGNTSRRESEQPFIAGADVLFFTGRKEQHGFFVFTLQVLETCMKNCGKRFHSEVGKFRFLNELIKVVSPKVDVRVAFRAPGGPF